MLHHPGFPRRGFALAFAALHLVACTSWRVQSLTPERVIAEKRPASAWVTRRGHSGRLLESLAIRNDSLVGWDKRGLTNAGMPLSEVASIELREHDSGKTIGLALGITGGVALLAYLFYLSVVTDPDY